MGCADGRVLLHLAQKYNLGDSVGIDISTVAIKRFESSISPIQRSYIHAQVGDVFNIPQETACRRFNVVIFGNATIHFILEDSKLEELLNIAKAQLRDLDSRMMVAVFDDGTPERLSFMDKRCAVV